MGLMVVVRDMLLMLVMMQEGGTREQLLGVTVGGHRRHELQAEVPRRRLVEGPPTPQAHAAHAGVVVHLTAAESYKSPTEFEQGPQCTSADLTQQPPPPKTFLFFGTKNQTNKKMLLVSRVEEN
jgi:hypothetical protein